MQLKSNNHKKNVVPLKVYIIGIIGAIAWGTSFIFSKISLSYLSPAGLMSGRMIVAVVFMSLLIIFGLIKVKYKRKYFPSLIVLGILQPCLYGLFEAMGIDMTTASESAILIALLPVVTALFNGIFLKEAMTKRQVGFIVLSFVGVVVTTVFSEEFSLGGKVLGYGFLILAVMAGASYTLLTRKVSKEYSPFEVTFIMSIVGLIFFNIFNFADGSGTNTYITIINNPSLVFILLFLGIVCSVGGFFAFNYMIAHMPAHIATTITISILTVTGVIAGIVFLGEPVTWYKLLGMLVIVASVIGVNLGAKDIEGDSAISP
ncbi:MAG: DMT family transporter [Anaerovoracaceae bacterium]